MPTFEPNDYVKVAFRSQATGETERLWVKVTRADDGLRVVFGVLDNEPLVNKDLRLGVELAVAYDMILEHVKPGAFDQ